MINEHESIYQIYLRNFTAEGTFRAAMPYLSAIRAMGFEWIYLTPIHPIGEAKRKGRLGSPYAIKNYRTINPELGSMEDFSALIGEAHRCGLKVMIDVVFNHTSPDSVLAREHPDWYLAATDGGPGRKCDDWSDVIDFDYGSSPHLWVELIATLAQWRDAGVDGFRCDVASLVPADFWKQARTRVNQYDPGTRSERYPLVWLAESVHPTFLKKMREAGFGAWSEPELHAAAFDLTYDYDGWERLEQVWKGGLPLARYLEYLYIQETLYPKGAKKLRFLENHDQQRAAMRFGCGKQLRAWTALYQFLPGVSMAYMGQELALTRKPDLFDRDPMRREEGDPAFTSFFIASLRAAKEAKNNAPYSAWTLLEHGALLYLRSAQPLSMPSPIDPAWLRDGSYLLVAQPESVSGKDTMPWSVAGIDCISGERVMLNKGDSLPDTGAMILRIE
ncbi:MAG: alpha-amylase family glycosyl hydrolase [Rectinema sp.]|nr:alpha-amylase family glycosyl hydrolase [Rectinema sp.]